LKIIIRNPEKPSIQEWQWNMPSGMHAKDEKAWIASEPGPIILLGWLGALG
jgi:hypothetical protein